MDENELIAELAADLLATSGGYLRNTLRPSVLTCEVCDAPLGGGWSTCYKCGQIYRQSTLAADQVASMIYAVRGRQSGFMMHGYKAARPVREHVLKVGSLLWIGVSHRACAGKILGVPITHWATVPSIPAKPPPHPLNRLVARNYFLDVPEVNLSAAPTAQDFRALRPENVVVQAVPSGAHVLLLDDTWVGGGHSESAAAALKLSGATHISILNVARWLDPNNETTAAFLPDYFDRRDFDPTRCPWTGSRCP